MTTIAPLLFWNAGAKPAHAQDFVMDLETTDSGLEAIAQPLPEYRGDRVSGAVEPGKPVLLPEDRGQCRILVFGADGAGFDFREHGVKDSDDVVEQGGVASSNVLD